MRPDLSRVGTSFHDYINQVTEDELAEAFDKESGSFIRFLDTIPSEKYDYRYAEDKWTIKEVLQHIIDAERIFDYRALRFARKDNTPLPGFDENAFAIAAKADARNWDKLVEEFKVVRRSSELLFKSFDDDQLQSDGISSNSPNYVLALGFIVIGHAIHHQKIIKERYL
ncbi:MAG TPA: DinB family protein [Chitinophagaceae bacterium]|nr:DinB family protein [Chitinophagaceae bacterium]